MAIITTYTDEAAANTGDKYLTVSSDGSTKLTSFDTLQDGILTPGVITSVMLEEKPTTLYTGFSVGGPSGSDANTTYHSTSQATVTFTLSKSSRVIIESTVFIQQALAGGADHYARVYKTSGTVTGYGNEAMIATRTQYQGGHLQCLADETLAAGTYTFTTYLRTGDGGVGLITIPARGWIKATVYNY